MNRIWLALWVLVLTASWTMAADSAALRRQQQAQEKARSITRQLVSRILDIQLRQLEENGLRQQSVYREIESMRGSLDELVRADMDEVVQLLVEAQTGPEDQRSAKFQAAQDRVRDIMLTLLAERQKLLKRLQIAEVAAHVRRMIEFEQKAYGETKNLPSLPQDEREVQALAVIKEQKFVKEMFFQLVAMLRDMTDWGGKVGAGASEGLRILKTGQVGEELDEAEERLATAEFPDAAESQFAVIKGLRALLEKIEETQGLISSDREQALKLIREMLEKQEALRAETQAKDLKEDQLRELVDRQAQLQKELDQLAPVLDEFPTASPLLEQAKAAAFEASADLFENRQEEAVAEQTQVIGALAEIEQQLQNVISRETSDRSADELAADVQKLADTKQQLEQIAKTQEQATQNAKDQPAEAKKQEAEVAEKLKSLAASEDLPSVVKAPIQDAQEAAANADQALADASTEAAPKRQEAAQQAENAVERALAQVEAELADTQRRQKAVEVGELARAAEALERAAAAERRIAEQASQAAKDNGLAQQDAAAMLAEHEVARETAQKIQEGVKNTAPQAAQELSAAVDPLKRASEQLAAAAQNPGEPSKSPAGEAARQADQAAETLEKAASSLRKEAKQTAQELAALAGEQLQQVSQVANAVNDALAQQNRAAAELLAELEAAREKVQDARIAQARAAGRPEAADAMQLARELAMAQELQAAADVAAQEVAAGKATSPLDAALMQQKAAEQMAALGENAQGDVAEKLKQAAQNAAQAAKETLGGNPSKAETARKATAAALNEAMAGAQEAVSRAQAEPAGERDAAAQNEAGKAIAEARQIANQAAPDAEKPLAEAGEQSAQAAQALETGDAQTAGKAQQGTQDALAKADEELQKAAQMLAEKTGQQLTQQGMQAGELADQAARVDPSAAAALQQAQQASPPSKPAAQPTARQAGKAQSEMIRNLERATASLAARQEQINRDQQIAEALTGLLGSQEQARDAIAQNAAALGEMPQPTPNQPAGEPPFSPAQMAAADALARASQQFAQAMEATGEGAAAVSGQEQVANQPIREGLEAASLLAGLVPLPLPEAVSSGAEPSKSAGQAPAAEGQPNASGQKQPAPTGASQAPGDLAGQGSGQANPAAMGTGFVPQSPGVTAQQIAGPDALSQAAQALAQALGQPTSPGSSAEGAAKTPAASAQAASQGGQPAPSPTAGAPSSTATVGGAAKAGGPTENQESPEGKLALETAAKADSRAGDSQDDSAAAARRFAEDPWFAKLPPNLRNAMQSKVRRSPPRGYEELLRRYFEE
jgi:hypothetical protein